FQLTSNVMEEVLHLFENRLNEIGDLLMESFEIILMKSTSDVASSCLIQAIKPERNFKKTDLLEFLIKRVDKRALKNALDHYKVGFKFNAESIKTTKKIRSLTVHSNLYYWILKKYGPNSEVTQKCFDDII
ncbi:14394_t:CDS:1, partial [Funneliformis mosseae]